jgi:hypothetical protein
MHITFAKTHFPDDTISKIITQEVEDGPTYHTIEMAWLESKEWIVGWPSFQSIIMTPKNSFGSKPPAMMIEDKNQNLERASYEVRGTGHMQIETIDSQTVGPDLCGMSSGKGKAMVLG